MKSRTRRLLTLLKREESRSGADGLLEFRLPKKSVKPCQVFLRATPSKQTIAMRKGCQLFANLPAPSALVWRALAADFYSKVFLSRIKCNSHKTNDRCIGYSTINRGGPHNFSA